MRTELPIMDPTKEEIEYYSKNVSDEQKYMKFIRKGIITLSNMADLDLDNIFVFLDGEDNSYYKVTSSVFIDSDGIPRVSYKKL